MHLNYLGPGSCFSPSWMPSGCTVWGNCSGCLLDGRNILCLLIWQVTLFVHTTVEITNMSITSQSSLMLLYNPSSRSSLHSTSPGNHKFASYNYRLFAFSRILYKWNQTECSFVWLFPLSKILFFFFLLYIYIYIFNLFIYLWLCWVFVSERGLSPVAASGGPSSSRCAGLSPSRPLPLRSTGSRRAGSAVVAHGPSRSAARGILPDQGSNPCAPHWQADSQPLRHQGSPAKYFWDSFILYVWKVCSFLLLSSFPWWSVHSFTCWWAFGLFLAWGDYK